MSHPQKPVSQKRLAANRATTAAPSRNSKGSRCRGTIYRTNPFSTPNPNKTQPLPPPETNPIPAAKPPPAPPGSETALYPSSTLCDAT
jgi:hypothetical protein